MARDPTIAYVLLRNSSFGPKGAASVELCVRDLVRPSRYAGSTIVVCPKVEEPFDGIVIVNVPDAHVAGNLGKAWSVGRMLRRRGVDVTIVERRPDHVLAGSRAGGFHSRTIEVLDQRGVADRFLEEGKVAQASMIGTTVLDIRPSRLAGEISSNAIIPPVSTAVANRGPKS